MRRRLCSLIMALAVFCMTGSATAEPARGKPLRVYGATFSSTYTIYAMSPELLVGWNGPLRAYEKRYIPPKYHHLPVLGGWYGQGFFPDREVLMRAGIDLTLLLTRDSEFTSSIEKSLRDLHMPVVTARDLYMTDYAPMFRKLGQAFGMPERGEALAAHAERLVDESLAMVGDVRAEEKPRVFLAQDVDGLGTVCARSKRSELINLAGAVNVHQCPDMAKESTIKVSFEQIMAYDPDVVLVMHPTFVERFKDDPKWSTLRAAREGRIIMVPYEPFCWMDKPSTYMRLIALPWLACTLHPERCGMDMVKETREFMSLFFHQNMDDEAVRAVLTP